MSTYTSPPPVFGATFTRAAPLVLGAADALTTISWDTTGPIANGFELSGGDVLTKRVGSIAGQLYVTTATGLLLSGMRAVITYDPGPSQSVLADLIFAARTVGDTSIAVPFAVPQAVDGKLIRVEVATIGVGSLGLVTAAASTKLALLWLG